VYLSEDSRNSNGHISPLIGVSGGLVAKLQAKFPHLQIHFLQAQPKVPKNSGKKTSLEQWQAMQQQMRLEEEQKKRFNDFNFWRVSFEPVELEEDDENNTTPDGKEKT